MPSPPIIIVCLRRPRNDPSEVRDDPFWEFGSFGCTGCHAGNLMHPRRIQELVGCRMAFAQGGPLGFRLVYLTPPVDVNEHDHVCELVWNPADMPFRYPSAPILITNDGSSHFPLLKAMLESGHCTTWEGQFRSNFRSRRLPLPRQVARQLSTVYSAKRRIVDDEMICETYEQALPWPPPQIDRNRRGSYERRLGVRPTKSPCARSRTPRSRCRSRQ